MIYNWYLIANMVEFLDSGLVSREFTFNLEGEGEKTVLVTRGNTLSLTIDGVMLAVQMNGRNPFYFEDRAVYLDGDSNLHYGFKAEE